MFEIQLCLCVLGERRKLGEKSKAFRFKVSCDTDREGTLVIDCDLLAMNHLTCLLIIELLVCQVREEMKVRQKVSTENGLTDIRDVKCKVVLCDWRK